MEPLDLQVHFFTVLGQQRREFVNYGWRGQSIVDRRVVDLLTLSRVPTEFLLECSGLILELLSTGRATPIELGVVPPRGGDIPSFFIRVPRAIAPISWRSVSFSGCLVSFTRKPYQLGRFQLQPLGQSLVRIVPWGVHPLHHEDPSVSIGVGL
jgi:hypothetical protein